MRGPRSVSRVTGVSFNTVSKLLVEAGFACAAFHDKAVRGVTSKAVQCDEIWSFSYAKTVIADSDEAGHAFQYEAGRPFRDEAGHGSDLKPATWRSLHGS